MPQGVSSQNIGYTCLEMQILVLQEMPHNKNFEASKEAELKLTIQNF